MTLSPLKLDNEGDADDYLRDLLAKPENRSLHEVERHAEMRVSPRLKAYFLAKAREILGISAKS